MDRLNAGAKWAGQETLLRIAEKRGVITYSTKRPSMDNEEFKRRFEDDDFLPKNSAEFSSEFESEIERLANKEMLRSLRPMIVAELQRRIPKIGAETLRIFADGLRTSTIECSSDIERRGVDRALKHVIDLAEFTANNLLRGPGGAEETRGEG